MKMVAMIGIIAYFWIWTADNRLVDMDVLEQLCKDGTLNITFHENRMMGKIDDASAKEGTSKVNSDTIRIADDTVFHNFEAGSIGHMPELKWEKDCKKLEPTGLYNNNCLIRSSNLYDAFVRQLRA
jgi:hypothetical protein